MSLDDAAQKLNTATSRRDYWRDRAAQATAYREGTASLPKNLQQEVAQIAKGLHPRLQVVVESTSTFAVVVWEKGVSSPVAACYIDMSTPPWLILDFIPRGTEVPERLPLYLDCYGATGYVWPVGDHALFSMQLPQFILTQLLTMATRVMAGDTPEPSLGDGEVA